MVGVLRYQSCPGWPHGRGNLGPSWPSPFGRAAFVGTWLLRSCSRHGLAPTHVLCVGALGCRRLIIRVIWIMSRSGMFGRGVPRPYGRIVGVGRIALPLVDHPRAGAWAHWPADGRACRHRDTHSLGQTQSNKVATRNPPILGTRIQPLPLLPSGPDGVNDASSRGNRFRSPRRMIP